MEEHKEKRKRNKNKISLIIHSQFSLFLILITNHMFYFNKAITNIKKETFNQKSDWNHKKCKNQNVPSEFLVLFKNTIF